MFDPFWTFIANNLLPDWLAPNAMTLGGLIVPLMTLVTIGMLSPAFMGALPAWAIFLGFAALFWYQTIDAVDGKQARRTDNCSPLGQLLDHNLDQISFTIIMCLVCALLQLNDDIWRILSITPGVMSAHYSIEYRSHFTGFHATVVGAIGATEQLCIIMGVILFLGTHEKTNDCIWTEYTWFEDIFPFKITLRELIIFGSAISGIQWTTENFVRGWWNAPNKAHATLCLIPYVQFFAMMFCSHYSRFFATHTFFFVVMNGLFLTYVTGNLNLNSTAGMKFNWRYTDPFVYLAIVYCDSQRLVADDIAAGMYACYTLQLLVKYLCFMGSVVRQLTGYLGISFLRVKQRKA